MARPYSDVAARIRALCKGEHDAVALMSTVACELYSLENFDWVGFCRVVAPDLMKIGPYQGGHGCLFIRFSRGVCGAATRERRAQVVADVDAFPGHIACAASTRSEIVVPVFDAEGRLIAVLDVDSDTPAAFDAGDAAALEALMAEVFARPSLATQGEAPAFTAHVRARTHSQAIVSK